MKKALTLSFVLASTFALASCSNAQTTATKTTETETTIPTTSATKTKPQLTGETTLDIIEINDLHGYVNSASYSSNAGFNLASISYYVDQKRKEDENEVILIANGDMLEGTAFSNMSLGKSTINVMNTMQFDMMGVGNHEFSWGLDSVLTYFDGNKDNGEANFPLVNGNVYAADNLENRYSENNPNDRIKPYTVIERAGLKIGILSYIGDIQSSISSAKLEDFKIKSDRDFFKTQVRQDAMTLKNDFDADFIIFNVHGGDSNKIEKYDINSTVADLKDNNGKYLIDAIINGHTHSCQEGYIEREGQRVPLVQGGSYCNYFGEITLNIDLDSRSITYAEAEVIDVKQVKKGNLNEATQLKIDEEYAQIKDVVEKVYCTNSSVVSKDAIGRLMAKDVRVGTSADISIMNTGGIRTELPKGDVSYSTIYGVYPFENQIICVKVKGKYINDWINKNASYYYMDYTGPFEDETEYNVATIDYVITNQYWAKSVKEYTLVKASKKLTPRDYLIDDLENRGNVPFDVTATVRVTVSPFGTFPGE